LVYACPAWEFVADILLLKLQSLQNKFLRTISKFQDCTLIRKVRMAFQVPYTYDYTTKLCRQQAELIQNHGNANVNIRKVKLDTQNIRGSSMAAVKCMTVQVTRQLL
jgi:hypothetical protein